MAIIHYDDALLRRQLDQLSREQRTVFAAACAERLFPAYSRFAQQTGRGEPETLRRALTRLWDDLMGNPLSELEVRASAKRCLALVPGEDEEPWIGRLPNAREAAAALVSASAEDAAVALVYALQSRYKHGSEEAAWSACRANDALDRFVMASEPDGIVTTAAQERALHHPLVQAELARQRRDLDELIGGREMDVRQVAARFRERAAAESAIFFGDVPAG